MEKVSFDWLAGFIEGEGNFNVVLTRRFKSPSWKYSFEHYPILQFRIFLREDDLPVLEKIKGTLGVGKIYKVSLERNRKAGINSRDQFVYVISSANGLLKLRGILNESIFHSKKKGDMEIFFKILELKSCGKHLTREGHDEIVKLAKEMNSRNRDNFRRDTPVTE